MSEQKSPLQKARDAVVTALMEWHEGKTNVRPVLIALERLERKATVEAVEPLVSLLKDVREAYGWSGGPEWTVIDDAIRYTETRYALRV